MAHSFNGDSFHLECKVCGLNSSIASSQLLILGKYPADLFRCISCGFEFFDEPEIWLEEAYSAPIAFTDTGIVARSLGIHRIVSSLLAINHMPGKILDWGSGSGLLVRLLRDDGFDCYGLEPYTSPILAAGHTWKDEQAAFSQGPYRAVIAIEVVEHLPKPNEFFKATLAITDTLIFSTELADANNDGDAWWYYSRETGQHISFYTEKSLNHLAEINSCAYASAPSKGLHIMTRNSEDLKLFKWTAGIKRSRLSYSFSQIINKLARRGSLVMPDHFAAKEALKAVQDKSSM